jgi:hypothetical protein
MKEAGIVVDNYKVEKFKSELIKNGYKDFKVVPYKDDCSVIKVKCLESQYNEVAKICKRCELHFKRSN